MVSLFMIMGQESNYGCLHRCLPQKVLDGILLPAVDPAGRISHNHYRDPFVLARPPSRGVQSRPAGFLGCGHPPAQPHFR